MSMDGTTQHWTANKVKSQQLRWLLDVIGIVWK
jgi:hypothetical protein